MWNRLKNRKASANDSLSNEIIKLAVEVFILLQKLFNKMSKSYLRDTFLSSLTQIIIDEYVQAAVWANF